MAGESRLQKEAAVMTPAAKPSMVSSAFLFIVLKKNTSPAPSAVTPQVKSVARSACAVCGRARNHETI